MNDLISRQDAIDAIHNLYAIHGSEGSWIDQKDAFKAILNLPSTQPEIIRCKDCKYASPNGKYGCKAYHFKLYETHAMFADDYCSRAERKEVAREHDKL